MGSKKVVGAAAAAALVMGGLGWGVVAGAAVAPACPQITIDAGATVYPGNGVANAQCLDVPVTASRPAAADRAATLCGGMGPGGTPLDATVSARACAS